MVDFTSDTYTLKQEILTFSDKLKFTADMTYGMLAAGRYLLTDVVDQFHEASQKINIIGYLSSHFDKGLLKKLYPLNLQPIKKWVPSEPFIHIGDSNVVKPNGYKFESVGIVRDGSESTATKNVYKKGIM